MADTTALKNRIKAAIKANSNQEITGPVLQQILLDIVDELSDRIINEYAFVGIAIPTTIPPSNLTEYSRVFYLAAQNGVYTNLGGIEVSNEIAVIKYDGSAWSKDNVISIDDEPTLGSHNLVKSGGVHDSLLATRRELQKDLNRAVESITPIEITGNVTNAPDGEDLTSVNVDGTDVLKFKDKAYAPMTYSGLGRKYLRKNIVDGVNILTQSMINQPNTIYIIQYDYDLNGAEITIPTNCELKFDGGSLSNGTITSSELYITAGNTQIFKNGGLINSDARKKMPLNVMWFGAKGDGINDDADAIQICINCCERYKSVDSDIAFESSSVYFPLPTVYYKISHGIKVEWRNGLRIYSEAASFGLTKNTLLKYTGNGNESIFEIDGFGYIIDNISIEGNFTEDSVGFAIGRKETVDLAKYIRVTNLTVKNCDIGIAIGPQTTEVSQDDFNIFLYSISVSRCLSQAINFTGLNTYATITNLIISECGYSPTGTKKGVNLYIGNGHIDLINVAAAADMEGQRSPKDCQIYMYRGFFTIKGWRSDTVFNHFFICRDTFDNVIFENVSGAGITFEQYQTVRNGGTVEDDPTKVYSIDFISTGAQGQKAKLILIGCNFASYIISNRDIVDIGTKFHIWGEYTIPHGFITSRNDGSEACNYTSLDKREFSGKSYLMRTMKAPRTKKIASDCLNNGYELFFNNKRNDSNQLVSVNSDKGALLKIESEQLTYHTIDNSGDSPVMQKMFAAINHAGQYSIDVGNRRIMVTDIEPFSPASYMGPTGSIWLRTGINIHCGVYIYRDGKFIRAGSSMGSVRPALNTGDKGYMFWDTTLSKPIWWNGTAWVDNTGVVAGTLTSGTFADKPTVATNKIPIGFKYFCTDKQTVEGATDGIEIIHKGNNIWVDALGRVVS